MTTVAQRQDRAVLGALLLALSVVVGYAVVIVIGFLWPEHPMVAIVASITVSLLLWAVCTVWFQRRTRWWRIVCILLFAATFVFPMVGAASLGTDLALEKHADRVSAEVVDIDVVQTNHREGQEAWKTTYTFVAVEDGRELGTVDYRGGKGGYDLEVGGRTDLMADPSGRLPPKLADEVDSSDDVGMIVMGGVLFFLFVALGLFWPMVTSCSTPIGSRLR